MIHEIHLIQRNSLYEWNASFFINARVIKSIKMVGYRFSVLAISTLKTCKCFRQK